MNYGLTSAPTLETNECLVIGLFSDAVFPEFAQNIDKKHHGLITRLATKLQDSGDLVWQSDIAGKSLLLVDCGKRADFDLDNLSKRMADSTAALLKERVSTATICIPPIEGQTPDWQLQHMLLTIEMTRYQLLEFKSTKPKAYVLDAVTFFLPKALPKTLNQAQAIAEGIRFTRDLANLPANICTPSYLAEQAVDLTKKHKELQCKTLHRDEMKKLGMGALLAVASGSVEPPQLIELQYKGGGDTAPIVLVGKGITFDSGGLTLKPAEGMTEMKYDMSGAASVLGTLKACALLKLPLNVVGIIASAENMLSGTAMRPGDIVTSMSGQTIEIINTDAEGRLVLADALTYAERFNPAFVIDIATLTGAVIVALGTINSGFVTEDEDLAQLISNAAKESGDKAWRLPFDKGYQTAIDSPLADMLNATFDRTASSITAACFLSRFTTKYRWAHLDIAGTAWVFGKNRNATGRPVPLLIQLLSHVANTR